MKKINRMLSLILTLCMLAAEIPQPLMSYAAEPVVSVQPAQDETGETEDSDEEDEKLDTKEADAAEIDEANVDAPTDSDVASEIDAAGAAPEREKNDDDDFKFVPGYVEEPEKGPVNIVSEDVSYLDTVEDLVDGDSEKAYKQWSKEYSNYISRLCTCYFESCGKCSENTYSCCQSQARCCECRRHNKIDRRLGIYILHIR